MGPPLFPGDFFIREVLSRPESLKGRLEGGFGLLELVANVVMFVPLGVAVAAVAVQGGRPRILTAAAVAFIVATLVESAQIFLPTRRPSWVDVLANTVGGVLGALLLPASRAGLARLVRSPPSRTRGRRGRNARRCGNARGEYPAAAWSRYLPLESCALGSVNATPDRQRSGRIPGMAGPRDGTLFRSPSDSPCASDEDR